MSKAEAAITESPDDLSTSTAASPAKDKSKIQPKPLKTAETSSSHRFIVFGAGFYWASLLLQNANSMSSASAIHFSGMFSSADLVFASELILLLAMLAIALFYKQLAKPRAQKTLAAAAIVGAVLGMLLASPLVPSSAASAVLWLIASNVGNACCFQFWGLTFTSLDKHGAERTTVESLCLAFALYLICSGLLSIDTLAEGSFMTYAAETAIVISVIPFLSNRYSIEMIERKEEEPDSKILTPFYCSRAFFGVCTGACLFLIAELEGGSSQSATAACLVVALAVVAFGWKQVHSDETDLAMLRFAPLIACGIVMCPHLGSDDFYLSLCLCSPAFIWIGWIILHSVQLSAIKDESGLDDVVLSVSEKVVYVAFTTLTAGILDAIPQLSASLAADANLRMTLVVVIDFLDILVCSYLLTRVIDAKETTRIVDNAFELSDQRMEPVFQQMREEYGLTARETDVLRLLARGMTRPAICEELCISDGTVRTHMWHIYQKMDIHSRDELTAIVDQKAREHVAK